MDGRRAAMNVLVGAGIGASVPVVAAVALFFAVDYFHPVDHLITLALLSMGCAAVGVAVNLPWDLDRVTNTRPVSGANSELNSGSMAEQARRYEFDPGFETNTDDSSTDEGAEDWRSETGGAAESAARSKKRSTTGRGPRGRFSISYRRALKILGLEENANRESVKRAYRDLAKKMHPDQFAGQGTEAIAEATEKFRDLQEAYDLVSTEY